MDKNQLLKYLLVTAAPVSLGEKLRSTLAAFAAILAVGLVSQHFLSGPGLPLLVASMGASVVLIFAVAQSPLAQPWPFAAGHLLSATIGVTCAQHIADPLLAAAIAVGLSILAMHLLHCLHPPGGAAALIPILGDEHLHQIGYQFVLAPVGLNVLLMLAFAVLVNRWVLGRPYPAKLRTPGDDKHKHTDPRPLDRLGLRPDDLHQALEEMDTFVDISEEDLNRIYRATAAQAARRRMGKITCGDIMSRDVTTVEYDTEIEEAWALLRYHKVMLLPVVDNRRRVIGTLSMVDILKRANLKTYQTFEEKLIAFIRRTPGLTTDKPEAVGHIMASPVITAREDMHIVELVAKLSDYGMHHIPIVNAEQQLVGIVTQSDLIAALYANTCAQAATAPSP